MVSDPPDQLYLFLLPWRKAFLFLNIDPIDSYAKWLLQMYNALSGLGGSGQVDPTVAANATVALLSATAGTALFIVGPIFERVGPRVCLLLGGWTYALYSGSLLSFNRKFDLASDSEYVKHG